MLLFRLTTKTYLSPQLLLYFPQMYPFITLPVIISFRQTVCTYLSSHLLFWVLADLPFHQPTGSICVCFSPGFTCTLIYQLICWSAHRQTHPKMNVPVNFDASGYNHEDLLADSTVCMFIDAPVQKPTPFICMHPFRITSTIYQSTQLLLYIYTDLPGNKPTSLSWCFPSG